MNYAVSNIAWPVAEDPEAYEMLSEEGVRHLEIAPPRFWPDLAQVTESEARQRARDVEKNGLLVCSFQSLLFGRPDLQVFGEDGGKECRDYLCAICKLAGWMGAGAMVFGSPKNRLRGTLSLDEATRRAADFFRFVGDAAVANGTVLCLEPNPADYGGDFLLTTQQVAQLVYLVDSPGIRVNLDMGEAIMNEADVARTISDYLPLAGHFHASEAMLAPFNAKTPAHRLAAEALKAADYDGIVSLEMKTPAGGLPAVHQALLDMRRVYG
ncbi:MAG: sugar or sugar nucleotide oxidoreductase [Verrucomicrobiaceae bacterium]|nr:sugar or sugar nucleotide oxidoreductase [Verrucomicrobiaceae bacterium]